MVVAPKFNVESFTCPHCGVLSQHAWFNVRLASAVVNTILRDAHYKYRPKINTYQQNDFAEFVQYIAGVNDTRLPNFVPNTFSIATCQSCHRSTLWNGDILVFPLTSNVSAPNADMSEGVQALYNEAAGILLQSPRGAAALLRLALQLLLVQMGKPGKNINNDIKSLVADGLSPKIQQALDVLRVVGNNAVHPGQIDLDDSNQVAAKLFQILNFIAEETLTKPKELDELYSTVVPEDAKQHIIERDGRSDSGASSV